jgi:hypothetical protein
MDYGMIGKVEKAKRYAQEPDRFHFDQFSITFRGDNNNHQLQYDQGKWHCDCEFFRLRGVCSHTMALERLLDRMLSVAVSN